MKRILLFGGICAALILVIWILNRYQLQHRMRIFLSQMPEGKNYQNEVDKQKSLYSQPVPIVFLGDSHMEQCEWHEIFPGLPIANRGIGGDGTASLTARLDAAVRPGTELVFLQIGVNDLLTGLAAATVFEQYKQLIYNLQKRGCRVVSTLPFFTSYQSGVNEKIADLNQKLAVWLVTQNVTVVNINPALASQQTLKTDYTLDGIHLNPAGYKLWIKALTPEINAWKPKAVYSR